MSFGELLVKLRTEKKIFQKELASYLNVSIGTISNYENGIHTPDLATLCRLADYFNVSTDYLLGRTEFAYDLSFLNKRIAVNYTISDIANTTLELTPNNISSLLDYLELLKLRNKK